MFILGKDRMQIANLNMANNIFIGADGHSIKINFNDGSGSHLGTYMTDMAAAKVIEQIAVAAASKDLFIMPSDEAVKGQLANEADKTRIHHHTNGKKTKGHGGS